jgi:AraC-like DNA-binding protein
VIAGGGRRHNRRPGSVSIVTLAPAPFTHLLLAGCSLGLSLAIALLTARDTSLPVRTRWLVALLALCGGVYSLATVEAWADWGETAGPGLRWAAAIGLVCLWQLVRDLFEERRNGLGFLLVVVALSGAFLSGRWLGEPGPSRLATTAIAMALVAHTLWMLVAGRADDLDAQRRRWRLWWVGAACGYVLAVLAAHHLGWGRDAPVAHGIVVVAGQVALKAAWLAFALGTASPLARWSAAPEPPALPLRIDAPPETGEPLAHGSALPPRADALRERQSSLILAAMRDERLYRRPRLALRDLAGHLGLPEHRARLLINQHLGFRNFNAFLNHFRLQEAALRLRSASDAHLPILTIALEAGFGSIGPFNRAFRDAFGTTPTEYRQGGGPPAMAGSSQRLAES